MEPMQPSEKRLPSIDSLGMTPHKQNVCEDTVYCRSQNGAASEQLDKPNWLVDVE